MSGVKEYLSILQIFLTSVSFNFLPFESMNFSDNKTSAILRALSLVFVGGVISQEITSLTQGMISFLNKAGRSILRAVQILLILETDEFSIHLSPHTFAFARVPAGTLIFTRLISIPHLSYTSAGIFSPFTVI